MQAQLTPVNVTLIDTAWLRQQAQYAMKNRKRFNFEELSRLGPAAPGRPWVRWAPSGRPPNFTKEMNCLGPEDALPGVRRADVFFLDYDLRRLWVNGDRVEPLRGVTLPIDCRGAGWCMRLPERALLTRRTRPATYIISFRGKETSVSWCANGSRVRPNLWRAWRKNPLPGVLVEMHNWMGRNRTFAHEEYNRLLLGSSFTFVLRGHGRWTYRLVEVMSRCSIPVILADGLTLPFEEIIDWASAAVRFDESYANDPRAIVSRLPSDPAVIERMQQRNCDIYNTYFQSGTKVFEGLVLALAERVRRSQM